MSEAKKYLEQMCIRDRDTVVGSFGLVTVAPFTALTAGILLTRKKRSALSAVQTALQAERKGQPE